MLVTVWPYLYTTIQVVVGCHRDSNLLPSDHRVRKIEVDEEVFEGPQRGWLGYSYPGVRVHRHRICLPRGDRIRHPQCDILLTRAAGLLQVNM